MEVMIAHARDPVTPPSQVRPEIPADLERVVLRCLAKKPDDRYPDTPSLAEDLDRLRRRRELVADARRRLVADPPERGTDRRSSRPRRAARTLARRRYARASERIPVARGSSPDVNRGHGPPLPIGSLPSTSSHANR